jgi:predicted RNase H-like HicB family nuclease
LQRLNESDGQAAVHWAEEILTMRVEVEREEDGRWIAEVPDLPGVMVYGQSRDEAVAKAKALALRVLADRLEHGEQIPELGDIFAVPT